MWLSGYADGEQVGAELAKAEHMSADTQLGSAIRNWRLETDRLRNDPDALCDLVADITAFLEDAENELGQRGTV